MLSYLRLSNTTLNGKSTEKGGLHLGICVERLMRAMETSVRTCSGLAVIRTGKIPNIKQCYHYRLSNDAISSSCVTSGESNGSMNGKD